MAGKRTRKSRNGRARHPLIPLPPCGGPKLHPFKHQKAPIEWLERLDADRANESGAEGCVFKVRIQSQLYALKVFKFFDPSTTDYYWGNLLDNSVPLSDVIFHTDPFYAECRAYGRIKQAQGNRRGKREVAVPCHGYLFLQERDMQILRDQGVDLDEDAVDDELLRVNQENGRARAIIKDFVPGDAGVNVGNLREILRDIRALNKLGIYVSDVRTDNFKAGKIVDFGLSSTEPHCIMKALDEVGLRDLKLEDLVMFDEMVVEEGLVTTVRAMPNMEYCSKLRSWSKY
ncbi:kinetochore Sim4 complex subunit FTA2-domain-containing protein [Chaetomium fimeti]|uniref:Kinetochore Sim4 complex subunit FTA2-domain-containing protein n=1 Tax=Chaetomium fimeti TaxID=1854472 RepID=A0AAE0H8Q0_9PEZI|nr:kinetochore Sim4 complex subunit FTA2-domain-containing protein [Chaetomium fimeti]